MAVTLPLEVYESFEKNLGREDAKRVVKTIETTISDVTEYKWKTSKEELLSEIRKEFAEIKNEYATKADLSLLEAKIRLYFLVLIFVIILTNSKALDLLYKLLGLVK
ncbi:MAG: hypothetical protein HQL06_16265 [Nitrospirae bacterium]|nr:hypothetical protein [Nitrospirota bacterium]